MLVGSSQLARSRRRNNQRLDDKQAKTTTSSPRRCSRGAAASSAKGAPGPFPSFYSFSNTTVYPDLSFLTSIIGMSLHQHALLQICHHHHFLDWSIDRITTLSIQFRFLIVSPSTPLSLYNTEHFSSSRGSTRTARFISLLFVIHIRWPKACHPPLVYNLVSHYFI